MCLELTEVGHSIPLNPPYGASRVGRGWQLHPVGVSRPIPSSPSSTRLGSVGQTDGSASSKPSGQGEDSKRWRDEVSQQDRASRPKNVDARCHRCKLTCHSYFPL